ncbi:MAG: ABC transporter permease [Elusimicrobiota bacterium]
MNNLDLIEKPSSFLGQKILEIAQSLGKVALLFKNTLRWMRHRPLDWNNVFNQMLEIGVRSLPVTTLTSLFTGMVLALQTGFSSRNIFNEPIYVGTVVGFSLVKELGPVLTAVIIAGRVGASIAAELGTMKVTEQIDALYTLGTNPIKYLAVPRFIACLVVIPILTVLAIATGIIGGFLVSVYKLHIPSSVYYDDIFNFMRMDDFFHGLIKSFFFAIIIVVVSCYKGFECHGGAEGVGKATTSAVVVSMVLILVSDYFITALLAFLGIG